MLCLDSTVLFCVSSSWLSVSYSFISVWGGKKRHAYTDPPQIQSNNKKPPAPPFLQKRSLNYFLFQNVNWLPTPTCKIVPFFHFQSKKKKILFIKLELWLLFSLWHIWDFQILTCSWRLDKGLKKSVNNILNPASEMVHLLSVVAVFSCFRAVRSQKLCRTQIG